MLMSNTFFSNTALGDASRTPLKEKGPKQKRSWAGGRRKRKLSLSLSFFLVTFHVTVIIITLRESRSCHTGKTGEPYHKGDGARDGKEYAPVSPGREKV